MEQVYIILAVILHFIFCGTVGFLCGKLIRNIYLGVFCSGSLSIASYALLNHFVLRNL
jgi:hypothetical protein